MGNPLFNKKLGQHILTNTSIITSLITRAKIKPTDIILEVGGGTGNLTIELLKKAKKVICYEKDPRLANELIKRAEKEKLGSKLQLILGDALKHDFPHFDMCISNTPYQISSPLTFKLLKYNFRCAYLMFQKEFADRLVARPGESQYCRLSVAVQINAKVDHIMKVSKNSFKPPPKVESAIVRIEPKMKVGIDLVEFDKILKICFLRKNRTLGAIFKGEGIKNIIRCRINDERSVEEIVEKILERTEMEKERANKMEIEDFLTLLLEFKKENVHFN